MRSLHWLSEAAPCDRWLSLPVLARHSRFHVWQASLWEPAKRLPESPCQPDPPIKPATCKARQASAFAYATGCAAGRSVRCPVMRTGLLFIFGALEIRALGQVVGWGVQPVGREILAMGRMSQSRTYIPRIPLEGPTGIPGRGVIFPSVSVIAFKSQTLEIHNICRIPQIRTMNLPSNYYCPPCHGSPPGGGSIPTLPRDRQLRITSGCW